jgi:hypothetical protein
MGNLGGSDAWLVEDDVECGEVLSELYAELVCVQVGVVEFHGMSPSRRARSYLTFPVDMR